MLADPDPLLAAVAAHAQHYCARKRLGAARCCFMEALARGFCALRSPVHARLARPLFPGAVMPGGARVPGTSFELDPVQAAFSIGALLSHPSPAHLSHPLGGLLAVSDYLARRAIMQGREPATLRDVLAALIQAHEIQVRLAQDSTTEGLHPSILTRVAGAAVVTAVLGGSLEQITHAVSSAWLDGAVLCPPTGTRTLWAAADATSRAVRHALLALRGERGDPGAVSGRARSLREVLPGGQLLATPVVATHALEGVVPEPAAARAQLAAAVDDWFLPRQAERIKALFALPPQRLDALPVNELMAELVCTASRPQSPQGKLELPLPPAATLTPPERKSSTAMQSRPGERELPRPG